MSEPLKQVNGFAAPLPTHNIDTDVIMPKRFLRIITREGLADGVFADLRYDEDGKASPDFILNRAPWDEARILVVGDNFGCGSSREHAVWGLYQLGIRALIGTSFAGIFYDNCRRNGLAAVTVETAQRDRLLELASDPATAEMAVDIERGCIESADGSIPMHVPADIRADLLAGRDVIAATLEHAEAIRAFEKDYWG